MSCFKSTGCRSQRRTRRPLLHLAAIWILITLACQLPGQVVATPPFAPSRTPAPPTATVARIATAPEGPPPPALVEVRPAPGSQLIQGEGFTLVFSLPMNRSSVEAAVQTSPTLSGSFHWQDDATVTFLPQTALPADSDLTLTVSTAAQSRDGQPLARLEDRSFRTAPALSLTGSQPAPGATEVDPRAAIQVSFNQPVDGADAPPAFTLVPAVQGRGEWQAGSLYTFYPEPGLKGGAQYTLTLDPSVAARLGSGAKTTWSFKTRSPHLLSSAPERQGKALNPDTAFSFTFNEAVDHKSLEDNFSLLGADGYPVHGAFRWSDDSSQVAFDPDVLLVRGTSYFLTLTGQVRSASGEAIPELPIRTSYLVIGPPALVDSMPAGGSTLALQQGRGQVALRFNVPLAADQPLAERVTLDPAVDGLSLSAQSDTLTLSGPFLADTHYTVKLSPDLIDRWNKPLGGSVTYSFQTAPAQPALALTGMQPGKTSFVQPGAAALPAQVEGLRTLDVSTASLSLAEYLQLASTPIEQWQLPESRWEFSWVQALDTASATGPVALQVPLTQDGSALPTGLYAVRLGSADLPPDQQPAPVLVASVDRHVEMRRSPGAAQVWAVRLDDTQPAAGETVELFDGQGSPAQKLGSLKIGSDGLARLEAPGLEQRGQRVCRAGQTGRGRFWPECVESSREKCKFEDHPDRKRSERGRRVVCGDGAHDVPPGRYGQLPGYS